MPFRIDASRRGWIGFRGMPFAVAPFTQVPERPGAVQGARILRGAASPPLDGEDRSGTWVERERGLTSLHQPRLAPGIDTVGHGPRHARQFVGQRHNRYVLVGPG